MKRFIAFMILMTLFGCSKKDNPAGPLDDDFVYPLSIGNTWSYSIEHSITNFRPLVPGAASPETRFTATSNIEIVRLDTLENTVETFVFRGSLTEQNQTLESESHYNNQENGFFLYRQSGAIGILGLPKLSSSQKIYFHGRYFNSVTEIIRTFFETDILTPALQGSNFVSEPLLILSYPLLVGKQWEVSEGSGVQKKVIGLEKVKVPAGEFDSIKIQWLLEGWDDLEFFEFISSEGLIKQTIVLFTLCAFII